MFHKTSFGKFGEALPCDRAGFVPEAGDAFNAFDFGGDLDEATKRAEAALDEWRESAP